MTNYFTFSSRLKIALLGAGLALAPCQLDNQSALARDKSSHSSSPRAKVPDDAGCPGCLSKASGLFARGNTLEAANYLRQWLPKCPNNLQIHLLLNTILTRLPDTKGEALEVARAATAIAPDSMLAHLQAGMTLLTMGDQNAAAEEFEAVVALDPANHDAWLALSELYGSLNEPDKAKNAAAKAATLSPSARYARTRTISSMNSAGNINGVRNQFKQFLGGSEIPTEGLLGLGEEALNMGYYDEANACFSRVLEQYPQSKGAAFKQCLSQYLAGNTQAALAALKPNKKNSAQSNPQALPLEALCYLSSGDLAAARQTIAKLNDLNSTEPLATFAMGYLAYKDGDYKKALSALNSAAAKDKSLFPAQLIAAKINLKQGDVIEATSQARELRKISGLLPQALALELTCRLKQDDLDKSNLAALKTDVLRLNQNLSDNDQSKGAIDLALGRLALTEGKLGDAKSYFAKAQNASHDEEVELALAALAEKEGNSGAEQEALEKALALAPGDIEALSRLGIILAKADQSKAEELLTKALSEGDTNPQAAFALANIKLKTGNIEEAQKLFKRSLDNGLTGPDKQIAKDTLNKK
ncbi:MAG: tetratricopeptide repeat protein [Candidatus Melainabacteria bacterium]|nr:tetratricopeptide repeat protein [Candidatus Melainabacteria bacterium]